MKRILSCFVCLFLSVICTFGLTACGDDRNENAVNLVAIDANNVGIVSDIDYFVVPEPAASAKVKAVPGLNFVGSLQSLYGGENGYPQAVVVAKNDLLGTEILNNFITSLSSADKWLLSDGTSVETIVNAVQSHLTAGMEPSMKIQNLTKSVIKNCGINFVPSAECKADIISFMEKLNSVSESSFGMPSEGFFGNEPGVFNSRKISVYAPDGAPALGLAELMADDSSDNIEYNIVNANTIQSFVGGENPKADICVLPVNLAVKLLGNGQKYKLIGTLTHGNLYLLSKNNTKIDADNLKEINGKKVGVVNLAAVPGLTFKLVLKNYGIEYIEPFND